MIPSNSGDLSRGTGADQRADRPTCRPAVLAIAAGMSLLSQPAWAQVDLPLNLQPIGVPDYVVAGVGLAPDYLGSDDYTVGVAPFARFSLDALGDRYISLLANTVEVNLVKDPNWRVGPAGVLRLDRSDVEDEVVDRLQGVGVAFEFGMFAAYEIVDPEDPRDRLRFGAQFRHDITGVHNGWLIDASIARSFVLGESTTIAASVGSTFASGDYFDTYFSVDPFNSVASGLPVFDAGAGFRDVRFNLVLIQSLSPSWHIGAGANYRRLLSDAADSPIVADRGSADQFVFGIGGGYSW